MDGQSVASSLVAVIDISVTVLAVCSQYYTAVVSARAEIWRLQTHIDGLKTTLEHVNAITVENAHGTASITASSLPASRELEEQLQGCWKILQRLEGRLHLKSRHKLMRRIGLRALTWPFSRGEVENMINHLERYQRRLMDGLQIDQTTLLLGINDAVKNLSLQAEGPPPDMTKSHFMVPFARDTGFVKRPAIQTWLRTQYEGDNIRISIYGLGGFGKSQLALEFAYEIHSVYPERNVFWVYGSSKSAFEESYRSLANRLALPGRHDTKTNILSLVHDWLQQDNLAPWLMILDSADDLAVFFGKSDATPMAVYLPKTSHGKILVTTRSLNVAERLTGSYKAIFQIPTMSGIESEQLLRSKLVSESEEGAASELVQLLDFVPLAVSQAAGYMNRRQMSLKSYIKRFQNHENQRTAFLNHDAGDIRRRESVSNSVVVTWQLTFEQISEESPSAANLLSLMSLFQSKNIPHYLLSGYNENAEPELSDLIRKTESDHASAEEDASLLDYDSHSSGNYDLEDDLDILVSYCLVSISESAGFCEMHSLVQFCTQRWLVSLACLARWKTLFLQLMSTYFPDGSYETWPVCQSLLPHIESILQKPPCEKVDAIFWSRLSTNVGCYLYAIGHIDRAEDLAQDSLQVGNKVLGRSHPATLASMSNIALLYSSQGRWSEAEDFLTFVLGMRKTQLGEDHPDTLRTQGNLASLYADKGLWKIAGNLQLRVVDYYSDKLGERHPTTLLSMSNLASMYGNQGLLSEAAMLKEKVLHARVTELGGTHPDTLISMSSLAVTFQSLGEYDKAEDLDKQVLEARKEELGNEHPATLTSMANVAVSYYYKGELTESEKLAKYVLEARRANQGKSHPDTLAIMAILASIYWEQGQCEEAENLGLQVVEARKERLGEDHPDTLVSMHNLAMMFWEKDRFEEAEQIERHVLEVRKDKIGAEHPHTLSSMHNLAFTMKTLGRSEEAVNLMRECAAGRRRVLGEEHEDTKSSAAKVEQWEQLET